MNHQTIRFWLLRQPRPASLRLTAGTTVTPLPIAQGSSWMQIARSVEALAPDLLEALDAAGNLIRAVRAGDEDEPDEDAQAPAPATTARAVPADAETARFELFARLLVEATRTAGEQARAGTEVAFNKLVEMCNVLAKRGESLERSLASTERLLRRAWEENADLERQNSADDDPLKGLVKEVVEGFTGKASEHQSNGKA